MNRTEVFEASGPTSGTYINVKIGVKDGKIHGREGQPRLRGRRLTRARRSALAA